MIIKNYNLKLINDKDFIKKFNFVLKFIKLIYK
jgi:hypothetical protein